MHPMHPMHPLHPMHRCATAHPRLPTDERDRHATAGEPPHVWRMSRLRSPLLRFVVCIFLLVMLFTQALPFATTMLFPFRPHEVGGEVRDQLLFLEQTLSEDVATKSRHFPQGELFTWEFYGLALQNIAETTNAPADRERAVTEVRRLLPKLDPLLKHFPYSKMSSHLVRGGVCWMGGQNLLRARLIRMTGASATPAEVTRFHADSADLSRAFDFSRTGVIETVPGQTWPVDTVFALDSLRIHDELYRTDYFGPAWNKWKGTVERSERDGLMSSMVALDGTPRDVPRGCALSWTLAVLPKWDAAYAAKQWAQYKKAMSGCAFGFCFFREYPVGKTRGADADSGPMVRGYGMAATAFALAAARANGDSETAAALQREGELLGLPVNSAQGRRYLLGAVPFFDVLSVWVKTVPMPVGSPAPSPFRPAPIAIATLVAAAFALLLVSARRNWIALNVRPDPTSTSPDQQSDAPAQTLQSPQK